MWNSRIPTSGVKGDMRTAQRQALTMELRYSYNAGNLTYVGTGRTLNLGDETICFETDQGLVDGSDLELRIPWPSRLQSVCALELVIKGPLIRKEKTVAVLRMESYEFQTHGDRSFSQIASCGITCNLAA